MTDREYHAFPFDILDGLWPTGFGLYSRRKRTNAEWIDVLQREVDRGLLRRVGDGSCDRPYRYEEVAEGICQRPSFVTTFHDASTKRLLDRLGLTAEGVEAAFGQWWRGSR